MLRSLPKFTYSGLTIVLSNPSRYDITNGRLLTSGGGSLLNDHCLRPEMNVMQCDVRLADDESPWLEGTRCILLLGEYAMHKFVSSSRENTLNEFRGSPLYVKDIPAIATFFPQDAHDPKNFEEQYNDEQKEFESDDGENKDGDEKKMQKTRRSNYAFWIQSDVRKCKSLLKNNLIKWPVEQEPTYRIYPSCDETINVLETNKGKWMDFDIETDYEEQNLLCFAFSFDSGTVYSVPVLDFNYKWAYSGLHYIMRALAVAVRDNTLVAHNGAGFDFFVLGHKYKIPIRKVFDTMVAWHRCYPAVEQSLGHTTSFCAYQTFHKDTDSQAYRTHEHMMQKLKYCAKDVFTMRLVREWIIKFAKTIPGLEDSIACANDSIPAYLIATLQGIRYDEQKRAKLVQENDRLMMQYLRMIELLIGPEGMAEVRSAVKGKAKSMPNSNKQCVKYFHGMLGYKEMWRNPPDKHGVRNISLAKRSMLKLRLQYENPVIDLCNAFRYTRLEVTTPLGFQPYKDDNDKIITSQKNLIETTTQNQQFQTTLPIH